MSMLGVGLDFSRMPVDPVSSAMVSSAVVPTSHYDAASAQAVSAANQAAKVAQEEARAAATERKKRADEYDALDLMQKVTDGLGLAVNAIPHRPSPNNIFVFSSAGDPSKADDWRNDGYQWKQNGCHTIVIQNHQMKKIYFHVYTNDQVHTGEFQRIVFKSDKFPDLVVVQYKGNADVAGVDLEAKKKGRPAKEPGTHSPKRKKSKFSLSSRKSSRLTRPTYNNVIAPIYRMPTFNMGPAAAETNGSTVPNGIVLAPVSKDLFEPKVNYAPVGNPSSMARLMSIAERVPCIDTVSVVPQNLVIGYHSEHVDDFRRLLGVLPAAQTQIIHFDYSYQIHDFTVTPLFYRNVMLASAPKLPLMYALYNGNGSHARKHLVRSLKKRIPEVAVVEDMWMVLNDDMAVVDEMKAVLPNVRLIRSPGDVICSVQNWFSIDSSRAITDNADEVLKEVTKLMRCNTHQEYKDKLCLSKLVWSPEFKLFYHNHIEDHKLKWHGWDVKQQDSNKHDGYLLARCPEFEQLIIAFQQWTDVPVEYIVIGLHFLSSHFANNNIWAKMGFGSYTLLQQFHRAFSLPADSSTIYSVPNPQDIISFLKENSFERVFEMMTIKRDVPRNQF